MRTDLIWLIWFVYSLSVQSSRDGYVMVQTSMLLPAAENDGSLIIPWVQITSCYNTWSIGCHGGQIGITVERKPDLNFWTLNATSNGLIVVREKHPSYRFAHKDYCYTTRANSLNGAYSMITHSPQSMKLSDDDPFFRQLHRYWDA